MHVDVSRNGLPANVRQILNHAAITLLAVATLLSLHREIEGSIARLSELRKRGKKVTLKFYDQEPFWKWNEAGHPEYDFDTNQLICRDGAGNETSRTHLGLPINAAAPVAAPQSAP